MKKDNIKIVDNSHRIISYFKSQIFILILIFITGVIYNFGMLASPYFEGILIDSLNASSYSEILRIVLIFVVVIFLTQIFRSLKRYFVRLFANRLESSMKLNIYNNILNSNVIDIEKENIGTLLSRCQSDCVQAVNGMRKFTTEIFDTVFLFIFYIIYLMFYDVKITLFALIPVALGILFGFSMRKLMYITNMDAKKINSKLSSETYSLIDHALMLRIYSCDKRNLKHYDETLSVYQNKNIKADLIATMVAPMSNLLALIGMIPIIILGIDNVINSSSLTVSIPYILTGNWTIGVFSTYITTFILLATKTSHTSKLFSIVEKGEAAWKRIQPYIKPYQEYESKKEVNDNDELSFNNYSINIDDQIIVKDFSFTAKKGEIIAVTGKVASGKSAIGKTFIHKLNYDGSLKLFGKEVKDYSLGEIKGTITYMGHRSELFTSTIKENIAFDEEKDVNEYLKMVSFTKDLESMSEKENTIVGTQGVKLSGGQQERIALARSLYHKKSLIILDDPFASVDIKTEHEIMTHLKEVSDNSIILFISHRLSYFPNCDKVLVINDDKTVSSGTHMELLRNNETYKQLNKLQESELKYE